MCRRSFKVCPGHSLAKAIERCFTSTRLYSFSTGDNSDTLACTTYTGAHVCVAYGFLEIKYYNNNGLFRTDKYAHVATGISQNSGYLKLSSTDWCVEAYEVTIS